MSIDIYDRVLNEKNRLLELGENPETLICNKEDLIQISFIHNTQLYQKNRYVDPKEVTKWSDVIGSTLFGLTVEYNERIKGIRMY